MSETKSILMVAAENDALPGAKVGGIGDVLRDIPLALAQEDCEVHVVLPDYGHLTADTNAVCIDYFSVNFRGSSERVALYKIQPKDTVFEHINIGYWIISHPDFSPCGHGEVYCHDEKNRPFATDATKYAFFCAAVAQNIIEGGFGSIDILHLHDWHSAFLAVLREYDTRYAVLKSIKTVYTIHNLALQGVRPFDDDQSSLEAWFPHLHYDRLKICDPKFPHCFNPMRAGIELCDAVHAVSPSYAHEIQVASNFDLGQYGGEGLDMSLRNAHKEKRLFGILNGCEYKGIPNNKKLSKVAYIELCRSVLVQWQCRHRVMSTFNWLADKRLAAWQTKKERGFVVTSVGRITDQKIRILKQTLRSKQRKEQSALDHILEQLHGVGVLVLVGSGQAEYENFLLEAAGRHENFIFLCGYSEALANATYASGDLFLMPSSFEPCGISQMLAMRDGQPCLVNSVGGLKDTVIDAQTGFCFSGATLEQQAKSLVAKFEELMYLHLVNRKEFARIAKNAKAQRFLWKDTAEKYLDLLY